MAAEIETGMLDIDPPARILRFPEAKTAAKPTSAAILSARQQTELRPYPEQMDRWAMLHWPDAAVIQLRAVAQAEGDLARRIDAL